MVCEISYVSVEISYVLCGMYYVSTEISDMAWGHFKRCMGCLICYLGKLIL